MIAMRDTTTVDVILRNLRSILRWCINHQEKALLCCGKLRDVMLRVGSPDMLLHGAISLFLWGGSMH